MNFIAFFAESYRSGRSSIHRFRPFQSFSIAVPDSHLLRLPFFPPTFAIFASERLRFAFFLVIYSPACLFPAHPSSEFFFLTPSFCRTEKRAPAFLSFFAALSTNLVPPPRFDLSRSSDVAFLVFPHTGVVICCFGAFFLFS